MADQIRSTERWWTDWREEKKETVPPRRLLLFSHTHETLISADFFPPSLMCQNRTPFLYLLGFPIER